MREYIPQDKLQKKLTKHEKWGPLLGSLFGMLTPFCSASVVPVTMGMATMGVSLGTVLSFLISAPLCNFVVLAMIYATFGFKVTIVYLALTFTSAVLGGWLITKTPWRNEIKRADEIEGNKSPTCSATPVTSSCSAPETETKPVATTSSCSATSTCSVAPSAESSKTENALRFALILFKKIIPYVLLGAIISGLSAAYLPADMVEKYVASLPEIALVSSVLKPKAVIAFVGIILTTAVIAGLLFQYVV